MRRHICRLPSHNPAVVYPAVRVGYTGLTAVLFDYTRRDPLTNEAAYLPVTLA